MFYTILKFVLYYTKKMFVFCPRENELTHVFEEQLNMYNAIINIKDKQKEFLELAKLAKKE